MNGLLKIARFSSWWYYKIPLFVVVLFITHVGEAKFSDLSIGSVFKALFLMVVGATFVSILNDFTDREVDLMANKNNNFSRFSSTQSALIMAITLGVCALMPWILRLNVNAFWTYFSAITSYILYSVKPLRFKDRGFWGMVFDSLGSVVFPMGSFLFTSIPNWSESISLVTQIILFLWLFFLAMRSILVHQVEDKLNDMNSGTNTFVTRFSEKMVNRIGLFMFVFEIASFLGLCFTLKLYASPWFVFFFLFYLGTQWLFKRIIWMKFSLFGKMNESSIVFMYDYYYSYLLMGLIFMMGIPLIWKFGLLVAIVILFPVYFKQQFNCLKTLFLRLTVYRHKEHIPPSEPE